MTPEQRRNFLMVLYTTVSLISQTLLYGVFAALLPISTHAILKRKILSRTNKLMLGLTGFMFTLSTAYWVTSVGNLIATLDVFWPYSSDNSSVWFMLFTLMNALSLINLVLTDAVVVWRAWVICKDDSKKVLILPLVFLATTFLAVIATICIRVAMHIGRVNLESKINVSQMASWVLSLLANISATSIIAYKAWQHSQSLREAFREDHVNHRRRTERILVLLVESGFIYCLSGIGMLVSSLIRLPSGMLGNVYSPVHVQVAGIYPTVILILVGRE